MAINPQFQSTPVQSLALSYLEVRNKSVTDCSPLELEDYGLQAEPFTSPPKWHLAHTSWFFETFILSEFIADYRPVDDRYRMLFNSYYQGIGEQYPRPDRGLLSRPTVSEIQDYRKRVDEAMLDLLESDRAADNAALRERCILGLHHEQQHQELFFTDIKYSLSVNPLLPAYTIADPSTDSPGSAIQWIDIDGGLIETGHEGQDFCFDNELPRHKSFLPSFQLADRLITNAEYQQFIDDGGYQRPELWLAEGWDTVRNNSWCKPLYWLDGDKGPQEFTLNGAVPRIDNQPVCHISGYEADAYATWAEARLPTEHEWELAAARHARNSSTDGTAVHPRAASDHQGFIQLFGDCWQWTRSAYSPYPGYKPAPGAIGEYNGKFMSSQWVLRGSSCVTPAGHSRISYRNFFYPPDRWQFSGLRLAR